MSKAIPAVQKYMSTSPHTIGQEQPLTVAHQMMREHNIRHLPVLHGGAIVGVISTRDLHLIESLEGVDPRQVTVQEAMANNPYVVAPDAPLDEVAQTMASEKYGSAVVAQHQKVVGILTTVDLCRALAELLRTRLAH